MKTLVLAVLMCGSAAMIPATVHADDDVDAHHHHHHHQRGSRNVAHGTAEAFRTAGSGVAYGVRSVGRAVTGRPEDVHDRAKMERHARQTREDFSGH